MSSDERGYTLVELLMVMFLMAFVMGGITAIFVSGSRAESQEQRFFEAQQQARAALDNVRADVHCASQATAYSSINGYPGVKLLDSSCYTSTPTITWCVRPSTALTGRYALWRSTIDTTSTCTSTDTTLRLEADDLMAVGNPASTSNIFTTPVISLLGLQTVGVDFKVNTTSTTTASDTYELTDSLVTRNYSRCTTTSSTYSSSTQTCSVPTVP